MKIQSLLYITHVQQSTHNSNRPSTLQKLLWSQTFPICSIHTGLIWQFWPHHDTADKKTQLKIFRAGLPKKCQDGVRTSCDAFLRAFLELSSETLPGASLKKQPWRHHHKRKQLWAQSEVVSKNTLRTLIIVLRNALKAYGFTVFNADITLEERLFIFSFYFCVSLITTDVLKKKGRLKPNITKKSPVSYQHTNKWLLQKHLLSNYTAPTCSRQSREQKSLPKRMN